MAPTRRVYDPAGGAACRAEYQDDPHLPLGAQRALQAAHDRRHHIPGHCWTMFRKALGLALIFCCEAAHLITTARAMSSLLIPTPEETPSGDGASIAAAQNSLAVIPGGGLRAAGGGQRRGVATSISAPLSAPGRLPTDALS